MTSGDKEIFKNMCLSLHTTKEAGMLPSLLGLHILHFHHPNQVGPFGFFKLHFDIVNSLF